MMLSVTHEGTSDFPEPSKSLIYWHKDAFTVSAIPTVTF